MCTATLFIITKNWELKYPSTGEWLNSGIIIKWSVGENNKEE